MNLKFMELVSLKNHLRMKLSVFLSPPVEEQGLILVNVFFALTVVEAQYKLVKVSLGAKETFRNSYRFPRIPRALEIK